MRRSLALSCLIVVACGGGTPEGPLEPGGSGAGGSGGSGGAVPAFEAPAGVDAGAVRTGDVKRTRIQLRNHGAAPLHLDENPTSLLPFATSLDCEGTCGTRTLDPGKSLEVVVDFMPEEDGAVEKALVLHGDFEGGSHTITLRGTGYTASATCQPQVLDFGQLIAGTMRSLDLTCRSGTVVPLHLQPAITGPAAERYAVPAEVTLEPGQKVAVPVELRASAEHPGSNDAHLELRLAEGGALADVPLTGLVYTHALRVEPDPSPACVSVPACTTAKPAVVRFNLRNLSASTLHVTSLSMERGSDPGFRIVPGGPFEVKPSERDRPSINDISTPLTLTTDQPGTFHGTVVLVSDDPGGARRTICVDATCTEP
jgi:hypothetical protein